MILHQLAGPASPARPLVDRLCAIAGPGPRTAVVRDAIDPAQIMTWEQLEGIVAAGRSRIDLMTAGRRRRGGEADDLIRELPRGATLQVHDAERSSRDLADLCGRMTHRLGGDPVGCGIFLSPPGPDPALPPHQDQIDGVVVQVAGSKRWRTWLPTMVPPALALAEREVDVGCEAPAFDGVLDPGDVLYIPRGHPHVAVATGEQPSLHVTLTVYRTPAADLLRWLIDEALSRGKLSHQWPFASGVDTREARARWVRQVLAEAVDLLGATAADDVLDGYLDHLATVCFDDDGIPRPGPGRRHTRRPSLRAVLDVDGARVGDRVTPTWALLVARVRGGVLIHPGGELPLDHGTAAVVAALRGAEGSVTVPTLAEQGRLAPEEVRAIVRDLAAEGLVGAA